MKKIALSLVMIGILSCDSDDDNNVDTASQNCDFNTLINLELFENAPNDPLTISDLEIDENCLQITFSASGCDGNDWEIKLIDSGLILESQPIQRNLRLSLKNNEFCNAVITKTLSFDLSDLQVSETNQIFLNITNSSEDILYEY